MTSAAPVELSAAERCGDAVNPGRCEACRRIQVIVERVNAFGIWMWLCVNWRECNAYQPYVAID